MNTYSQVSLLIDFVRQNSEFADQFDPSRIDLNGKTRIDKNRKQILYCKQSAKGWITANLFDIRTNETKRFSGFEATFKEAGDFSFKPTKPLHSKPAVKTPEIPKKTFSDWLGYYQTLPVELPANVPYFSQKIGNDRLALIDGLRVGKYFGNDAAIVPLRNSKGEIASFQFFGDKALINDSNKAFCEGVKGTSIRFGADLEISQRQFIGEGIATLISGFNVVKNDLNLNLETDCFINGLNAGNIKNFVSQNKEALTNPIFFADNDVIDATNPNKKNMGLLTAIEACFLLGVQNEKRILIPQDNGLKCDFNDIENKEGAGYVFLSAKEVLTQFELLNNNTIRNSTVGLKEIIYFKNKNDDFTRITVKDFIKKRIDKSDLTIQINRKNKVITCELICNGKDYFLSALNEFGLYFLPIEEYLFEKVRNGKTTYFNALKESINLELNNRVNNQIDAIVSNLMQVDYRGASEHILDKVSLTNGKYLPINLAKLDYETMLFHTSMGTGKSFIFSKIIELARASNPNISILTISPLVSLIEDLSRRLKLTKYSDFNGFETNQLITTLHSLIKHIERFKNETDLLFLDEINHILSLFNSTTLKGYNTVDLFNRFKNLIRNAKKVYIADAYLSQNSIDFIAELRDMKSATVIRFDFVESNNKTFQMFEDDSTLDNEVFATIENNRNVAIVCSSANKTEVIGHLILKNYPTKNVLIINSETTGNVDVQNFLNNPNEEIRNYDVIIYSPAISGGVSFDDLKLTPDFEIFGYFMPFVHTASDFMQMLGRFRRKSDIKLFIDTVSDISNELKLRSLNEANKSNYFILIDLLESTFNGSDDKFIIHAVDVLKKEIDRGGGDSDLNKFLIELIKSEIEQKKCARHILIKLLENAGYKNAGVVSGKNENAALLSKEAKEAVIIEKIDRVQKAQPIDEVEHSKLKKKHKRSTKEANQLLRFKIENRFKLDLTHENIKFVLTKENEVAAAYKASLMFLSDDKLIEKAVKEMDFESDSYLPVVLRKFPLLVNRVQTQIFSALNIKLTVDGFDVSDSKPVTIESLKTCFEWIKTTNRNGSLTAAGLKPLPPQPNNRMKWIKKFLIGYGFGIDNEKRILKITEPLIGKIAANLAQRK